MNRNVWITGASQGIGRAVALALARSGDIVAATARTRADLDALAEAARDLPGDIHPFCADITDAAALQNTFDAIEDRLGRLDLALFNAGTHIPVSADAFDVDNVAKLVGTNLMGTVHGLSAVMPAFIARRSGHIAVVSSVAGYRGLPSAAGYGATKAALINMCEALKPELDRYGVKLTLINPGFVKTPLTDRNDFRMPFLMEPGAAAERVVSGLDSGRFEVTFPRRFTWMLKLLRCLPYSVFFFITRRLA